MTRIEMAVKVYGVALHDVGRYSASKAIPQLHDEDSSPLVCKSGSSCSIQSKVDMSRTRQNEQCDAYARLSMQSCLEQFC